MQIEQIDMDAAAALLDRLGGIQRFEKLGISFAGIDNAMCGAFADHRLAALSARPAVGEDVVERVELAMCKADGECSCKTSCHERGGHFNTLACAAIAAITGGQPDAV